MVNELIKITTNEEGKQLVSARELYDFLEPTERFSKWFERYCKYGFEENSDYIGCKVFNTLAKQELQDYAMTIEMAKEFSMLQRSDKGKQARLYFIECEKKANNPFKNISPQLKAIFALDERTQKIEKDIKGLEQNIEEIKNDVPLFNIECEQLQNAVRRKGIELLGGKNSKAYQDRSTRTKVYLDIQSTIKRNFGITSYKALKRKQLDKAIKLVNEYKLPIILEEKINELNNQISF